MAKLQQVINPTMTFKYTNIWVVWLKDFYKEQKSYEIRIALNEDISIVYDTLKREEGLSMEIVRLSEDEIEYETDEPVEEEIRPENRKGSYHLDVDLTNSNMTFKKFNELLNDFSVNDIE